MSDIFEVKNQDRRQELIEAFGKEWSFKAQKPTGSDVEYFSPETGFVLLSKQSNLDLSKKFMQRVYACAKLSLGPTLELRERSIGKCLLRLSTSFPYLLVLPRILLYSASNS